MDALNPMRWAFHLAVQVGIAGALMGTVTQETRAQDTGTQETIAYWITQLSHDHFLRRENGREASDRSGAACGG